MATDLPTSEMRAVGKSKDQITIGFSFGPNGASAPLASSLKGFVSGVTLPATGKFLCQMPDGFPKIQAATATLQFNGAGTVRAQVGLIDEKAGTIEVYLLDSSNTATNLSAAATTRVNVIALVENRAYS